MNHLLTVHAVTAVLAVWVRVSTDPTVGIFGLQLDDVRAVHGDDSELTAQELCAAFDVTDPEVAVEALYEATADALAEVSL